MSLLWKPRDLDLVETLTCRVRILSLQQAACIWSPGAKSERPVRRWLRRLANADLIDVTIFNAHPPLEQHEPLFRWSPGEVEPDFETIAAHAQARWNQPAIPLEVCSATKLAANLFGSSSGGLPALNHRDHDLLLGHAYTSYRLRWPDEAACWVGEDMLPKAGYRIKDPDAFLVDAHSRVLRVIESAGRYDARQVESFHFYCEERDLAYDLW